LTQRGTDLMLANQLAQEIADSAAAVAVCGGNFLDSRAGTAGSAKGTDLLKLADTYSIGFAQGAIDRASFCHLHFGCRERVEGHWEDLRLRNPRQPRGL
jgi:hypothetical protein